MIFTTTVLYLLVGAVFGSVVVTTKYGSLQSLFEDVVYFKGVPHSKPPLGELRFMSPIAPEAWKGTRNAKDFASDCMQWKDSSSLAGKTSEDCLYLNIWYKNDGKQGKPVMLFFYGGSWSWGGTQFDLYNGERFIKERDGVILVTANYRLGPLGFLAAAGNDQLAGNQGLLDQRNAMIWISENIAAFGGDPARLTIFGESAGSGSVSCHLVMPASWPYFSKAMMESGPMAPWIARPLSVANDVTIAILEYFNCTTLQCLQKVPAEKLMGNGPESKVEHSVTNVTAYNFLTFGPVFDVSNKAAELVDHPIRLAKQGRIHKVPILLGTNLNEGTLFVRGMSKDGNTSDYKKWVLEEFGPAYAPQVLTSYPATSYPSPWWAATQVITDSFMACPARFTARTFSKAGVPVFLYQFTHVIDEVGLFDKSLGVFHASELVFVFAVERGVLPLPDHVPVPIYLSKAEIELSHLFTLSWSDFATMGSPGGIWPVYNATGDASMRLDLTSTVVTGLRSQFCDFWDSIDLLTNPQ